jgi:hypothetical protein
VLLPAMVAAAAASSSQPAMYIFDPASPTVTTDIENISLSTLQLLLSHRLGISQEYSLEGLQKRTIYLLNAYGGATQRLLGADEHHTREQGLVIVDGVKNTNGMLL